MVNKVFEIECRTLPLLEGEAVFKRVRDKYAGKCLRLDHPLVEDLNGPTTTVHLTNYIAG
ncbi:hypothetical protein [Paenibacillus sp. NPDC093718]|uniref:hypothetical protein n=1 Tax=Paenibacillus sp. NPDC093718 TaxID=3390601 RepID=UPI003D01C840